MSRFVDDDWSAYRAADAPRPEPRTWAAWVRTEKLVRAGEVERRLHWSRWAATHTPSAELLESLERNGRGEWVDVISRRNARQA